MRIPAKARTTVIPSLLNIPFDTEFLKEYTPTRVALSTTILAFCKPINAMNRPMPALTACFRLTGMTLTTASLSPRKDMAINNTPLQKITPEATSGAMPSLAIIAVTIPTLPSPGASAKGLFV